jgi:hypothetical protein
MFRLEFSCGRPRKVSGFGGNRVSKIFHSESVMLLG